MESNSLCNHISDWQNWTTVKRESNLSITSMITDGIGQQEVLLPTNHSRFNFRKQQIHLNLISPVETMSKGEKFLDFGNYSISF